MASTRVSGASAWMAGSSSNLRLPSSIPFLEDDPNPRWRHTPAPCQQNQMTQEHSLVKDDLPSSIGFSQGLSDIPSSTYSKGILEEDWYMTTENSLMDEMKELSYAASSLATQSEPMTSSHYSLDSTHLNFLSRNASKNFNSADNRSYLSNFMEGGGLPFDTSGTGPLNSFGHTGPHGGGAGVVGGHNGNAILHNHGQIGLSTSSPLAGNNQFSGSNMSILPNSGLVAGNSGFSNLHSNSNSLNESMLLSNISSRPTLGGSSFGQNLSGFLNGGISNAFSCGSGPPIDANFAQSLSSSMARGAASVDMFNSNNHNSLGRTIAGNTIKSTSPLLNVDKPPFRSKAGVLSPDAVTATVAGSQQTIFQKRAALRRTVSSSGGSISPKLKTHPQLVTSVSNDSSVDMPDEESPNIKNPSKGKKAVSPASRVDKRPPALPSGSDEMADGDQDDGKDDDDMDESGDVSGMLYEDDAAGMDGAAAGQGMLQSGGHSGEKGKGKKGLPAKNLMAERRRRKKLNDRLYMLRSVVPKITKMDRASILGDAIDYLRDLVAKIHELHAELDGDTAADKPPPLSPSAPLPMQITSALAYRVKEEPPSTFPDLTPTTIEVSAKEEGKALNIHMLCARKPGLLLSIMRALDGLGLEVEQGVVSCFNGFALDIFRAEQLSGLDVGPEEIRQALLLTTGASPVEQNVILQ
ncbi:protein MpBHLH17 [Marchantia polymorpha subsp. ruderalis]|uniref:BHLH domain-containing protein n=2 Tax=Marchantia polymorpha TaxID=3197 RepID=A0A176VHX4_MARPO|nr:hypothetical protein AXG93_1050s1070 [Marchantia polymorpha subsp. ruderalis]PTQ28993.1 hypothetical protein MARPO_0150s0016 [Marchantia polymorpha]BBN07601.1 hypothetical protein Mp_4g04920 [Marchantia polymorpha subsp. ruderalis]|eukprot:PTQ28993.1 hypothetical protein MARPO_0150s0016 [Marchantia polymorpha]